MPKKLTTSSRQANFVFGRLNLIANYENYEEKYRILYESLRVTKTASLYESDWSFTDVEQLQLENSRFFHGFLVKSADLSAEFLDKSLSL